MLNFPFLNYPYIHSANRNTKFYNSNLYNKSAYSQNSNTNVHSNVNVSSKNPTNYSDNLPEIIKKEDKKNSSSSNESEEFIFNLFGIKIYFDDLIILALLFFLYNEGVKDDELFISLLLLLLS